MSQFDETDLSSYYFTGVKHEDSLSILGDEPEGTFLVRDSSRGGYVVCVKENNTVMEYLVSNHSNGKIFIRSEFHFKDLPALLSFYKRNMFTSTALIRPVAKDKVMLHRHPFSNESNVTERRTMIPGSNFELPELRMPPGKSRVSAPPSSRVINDLQPPVYAKVIRARTPISYESQALPLKVGDIIRITKKSNGQGTGELYGSDKVGTFPLAHVEFLKDDFILPQD